MRFATMLLALAASAPAHAGYRTYGVATSSDLSMGVAIIMSAGSRAAAVRALKQVPSVGVVRLDIRRSPRMFDDSGLPDVSEFRIAAGRHAAGIAKLRSALKANPVTRKALAARGIPVNRVVGVRIGSNGSLRLYML